MTRAPHIHLGFECQTGSTVELPLHHLIVTGLTQSSGKTTTLEALLTRSGLRAIVFATKRGERDFPTATEVRPFFRERIDWQYVQSLLEATMNERMKFERSWIIKVSHGAKTLEEVHANVQSEKKTARGLSQSVYTTLDAYLNLVLPEIRRANLSSKLQLFDGLNLMPLGHLKPEVQALVIQSVIDEIYRTYRNTIVVIPEAWKFLPQGKGNPVKYSAEKLIREGAVLGNYVFLDSQDCAGVSKTILKSVDVWLLGRQREANEIKRMIDQIPVRPKPKPEMIAQLELGQFVACFGSEVKKVYVQPSWMKWGDAQSIATGQLPMNRVLEKVKKPELSKFQQCGNVGPWGTCEREPGHPGNHYCSYITESIEEEEDMGRIEELEKQNAELSQQLRDLQHELIEERMKQKKPHRIPEIPNVIGSIHSPANLDAGGVNPVFASEEVFDAVIARLKKRPEILRVAFAEQRIEIDYQPVTITVEGDTFKGRVARLIRSGFFDEPRTNGEVTAILNKTGKPVHASNVSRDMKYFVETEFLQWADSSHYQSTVSARNRVTMKAGD